MDPCWHRLGLVPAYAQNCQVHPLIFGALAASQKENQQLSAAKLSRPHDHSSGVWGGGRGGGGGHASCIDHSPKLPCLVYE